VKMVSRIAAWSVGASVIAAVLNLQACGGTSTSNGCVPRIDQVTARSTQVTVSNSSLLPPNCKVLATPNTQIEADTGGKADTQFGDGTQNIGQCSFHQLSGTPKPATFATRQPSDALFTETNGAADCTVNSVLKVPLCGLGTMWPDGSSTPIAGTFACNNDPTAYVAIYRGAATLSVGSEPAAKGEHVSANDQANLVNGTVTHSVPQFSPEQISLFDVQLDALVGGVSLTDKTALLQVRSLSSSNVVVAPNVLQKNLGQDYGNVKAMCSQASSVPVVFYPVDPNASTPRLYGAVCSNKTATVYGVAIYRQKGFGFGGPYFKENGGGSLIRTDLFPTPTTLEFGSSKSVFAWNGSLRGSGADSTPSSAPAFAQRDIYVLKFLYELPPDTTPRIGFVAVSLFGAPFPNLIG